MSIFTEFWKSAKLFFIKSANFFVLQCQRENVGEIAPRDRGFPAGKQVFGIGQIVFVEFSRVHFRRRAQPSNKYFGKIII